MFNLSTQYHVKYCEKRIKEKVFLNFIILNRQNVKYYTKHIFIVTFFKYFLRVGGICRGKFRIHVMKSHSCIDEFQMTI